ncbi:MAG: outer membrane lipoprotein carrier protein LolA [Rhodothermus sp.]|nr:outer membrane lipoprotein carrier protein LolA [Rhodothermus sp.]
MKYFTGFLCNAKRRAWLWVCFSFWSSLAQAQDTAHQLMEQLRTRYQQIEALQASFVQLLQAPYAKQPDTLQGRIWLQGDRYRIETPQQTIVTDGHTIWVYLHDTRQVLINDYVPDETAFSLNEFLLHYRKRYEVSGGQTIQQADATYYRLHLQPLRPDVPFQEVVLWVRTQDLLVTRVEVRDVNDTRMTFVLSNLVVNPTLSADMFTFHPPAGAEVVDLRQ